MDNNIPKQIKIKLKYQEFIKIDKNHLDLIFTPFNIHRLYRGVSTEQLGIMLNLFSNNKYFQNSPDSNYNDFITNLSITSNESKYLNIINIQMLYDFYDFLNFNDNKYMRHIQCLYIYLCKVDKIGGDFYSLMINEYIKVMDFNYVIFRIVNNYHNHMQEEILNEYEHRRSKGYRFSNVFKNDIELLVKKLNKLKSKYIFIKLAIFKISNQHILISDIFNVIFNISLKIN